MSQEDDFNALLPKEPAPSEAPPVSAPAPTPATSSTQAPAGLADQYMRHSDDMRSAAVSDEFNAMLRGAQTETPAGVKTPPTLPPEKPLSATPSEKLGKIGADVGIGVIEAPRAIVKGVRDAYQSIIDLNKDIGPFIDKLVDLPAIQLTGEGAPRIVSAEERRTNPSLPPSLADSIKLPDINAPTSVTGTIEKNVVQFVTGMSAAGTQLKALGLPTELSGWAARGATALKGFLGMFEAFDGSQKNLSNLMQSVPALANPVNGFLATDPKDGDAVNRLKTSIEGTIGGQLIDGLVAGLRFLRSANAAKEAASSIVDGFEDLNDEGIGTPKSGGIQALGDMQAPPDAPLVYATFNRGVERVAEGEMTTEGTTPEAVTKMGEAAPEGEVAGPASPGATEANAPEPGVYVNFTRIDGPDDIKRAMSELAGAFKDNIDVARRGEQTFEQTKLGAASVDAWGTLMSRRVGQPLNAEESLAARQLWATSAAKTYELAGIATAEPTPENLFAFRKMLATHAAIQEQVIAARTETARALNSWKIPAGSEDLRMTAMLQSMKSETGPASDGLAVSLNMAQRVQALQEAMDVEGLNNFTQKSVYATTRDAALEAWTNGLLTSPLTHVKVAVSNAATTVLRIAERAVASRLSNLLGDTDGVALGEASAQYSGLVSGLKDAFRFAGRAANAFLNEEPLPALENDPLSNAVKAAKTGTYSAGEDVPEVRFGGAISSQAFHISQSGWVGQGVDLLGQLIRSPGRALTAEHDFFRSIGYRMEVNALATRQATQEVTAGKITEDALAGRIAEIVANPPNAVNIGAIDAMKYQSFTDAPGKLAALIEQARTDFPLMRVILPFYKIPSRILSFTFERTPLAPLMSAYQANIAASGARASIARAQMALGTGMMLATADAVLSGQVTGSGPPLKGQREAMENQGWLPYSMKVGDRWVQYNRIETVGSSMAMAADVVETLHNYHSAVNGDNVNGENLAAATVLSVAQDITSKTYLEGLSRFFEALANPKTGGEAQIRSMVGSAVPAGVAAIDRLQDPYQRSVYSIMDAVKARTPGASETLPPRRNVWGEPISHASGMGAAYDLLSPFATRAPNDSPIDKEITRLGMNVQLPAGRTSFGQGAVVNLQNDPHLYSRYVELAGNGYKDPAWGMGAHDMLNSLVAGTHQLSPVYNMRSDGPDGGKAEMIKSIMSQYRDGAKRQLLQESPQLAVEVQKKADDRQQLKMPVIQ